MCRFGARMPSGRVSGRHPIDGIGRPRAGEHRLAQRESPRPVRENRRNYPNGPRSGSAPSAIHRRGGRVRTEEDSPRPGSPERRDCRVSRVPVSGLPGARGWVNSDHANRVIAAHACGRGLSSLAHSRATQCGPGLAGSARAALEGAISLTGRASLRSRNHAHEVRPAHPGEAEAGIGNDRRRRTGRTSHAADCPQDRAVCDHRVSGATVKGVEAVSEGIRVALDRSVEIPAPTSQVWDRAGILRYFTRA